MHGYPKIMNLGTSKKSQNNKFELFFKISKFMNSMHIFSISTKNSSKIAKFSSVARSALTIDFFTFVGDAEKIAFFFVRAVVEVSRQNILCARAWCQ